MNNTPSPQIGKWIVDDLEAFVGILPAHIQKPLRQRYDLANLLEVVLDLGCSPAARFPKKDVILHSQEITKDDLSYVSSHIGIFGDDNRAGIERTLHRISAIRNRTGVIVGLTCRVGRAVYGTINIIKDLVPTEDNILLLGKPGVGKTTLLREISRVLADEYGQRVIIVDTSNEIAGDGDISHSSIGKARRMPVPTPTLQHAVMIEAVENHMPEVIIIDEMGTELEALAARTIAERGVQLVATAHGNTLNNLVMNPTLTDLVGGIQTVTLGDEEARRRGTRKSILERKAPPTFNIVIEIQDWNRVAVHHNVGDTVDAMLRGISYTVETRWVDQNGQLHRQTLTRPERNSTSFSPQIQDNMNAMPPQNLLRILPYGISRDKLDQVSKASQLPVELIDDLTTADLVVTTKAYYRRRAAFLHKAEAQGKPVYVIRKNTPPHLQQFLAATITTGSRGGSLETALQEAENGASNVLEGSMPEVELKPQGSYVRRLQHLIAERHNVTSQSKGQGRSRRVTLSQT